MVLSICSPISGILRDATDSAIKVGLSTALLILAVVVSTALPPSFLEGRVVKPEQIVGPSGYLLVSVALAGLPVGGVVVSASQSVLHGVRLTLETNHSGQVDFPLPTGHYGVLVTDPRFSLETFVDVFTGATTRMQVAVNRTTFTSLFAAAQDSTSVGEIEPWNVLLMEVEPSWEHLFPPLFGLGAPYIQYTLPGGVAPTVPRLGSEVFVQPMTLHFNKTFAEYSGPEVPSTVISQVAGPGVAWLTLQPDGVLEISRANYILVIWYSAGSSVTYPNV